MDADGAKNWQWFIVVKPSPELIKHLRTDNAFCLVPATTPIPVAGAPEWFRFHPADADLLQATGPYLPDTDLRIAYESNDEQPLLNRFEVRVLALADDNVVLEHTLDFNLRTGFDASDLETLDEQVTWLPYVDPVVFGDTAIVYSTELVIPESWLGVYDTSDYRIEVSAYDIWDNETTANFAVVPEPRLLVWCLGIVAASLAAGRRR